MKTIQTYLLFLLMAVFTISVVSCEKTDPNPSTYPSVTPDGLIVHDMGAIKRNNDTLRNMQVVLVCQGYSLNNSNGVLTGTGAKLRLNILSNKDGYIPSGNYTYATTANKLPFTYADATVQISDNSTVNGIFVIYNGTLNVQKDSTTYSVGFNGLLSNGYTFSATYHGSMAYKDGN